MTLTTSVKLILTTHLPRHQKSYISLSQNH